MTESLVPRKREVLTQIQHYPIILVKSIIRVMDLSHMTACGPFKGTLQGKCMVKKKGLLARLVKVIHILDIKRCV